MIRKGAIAEGTQMNSRVLLLIASLGPTLVFAEGCDVLTRSQCPSVPLIVSHS